MKKLFLVFCVFLTTMQTAQAMPYDKKLHFGVSTAIGIGTQAVFDNMVTSFLTCSSFGLAKEIKDQINYHGFSKSDLAYDMAGCALGIGTYKMVDHWFINAGYKGSKTGYFLNISRKF